jgi:hypothetical protein
MEVQVTVKNVYGQDLVYPANDAAIAFASMVGRKTLTHRDLQHIEKLGFVVKQVMKPLER